MRRFLLAGTFLDVPSACSNRFPSTEAIWNVDVRPNFLSQYSVMVLFNLHTIILKATRLLVELDDSSSFRMQCH